MHCNSNVDIPLLRGPVPLSHLLIRQFVRSGDRTIDATCGNGNDTVLLAELVGSTGRVWSFDIQQQAIAATTDKLADAGYANRVELVRAGHETIAEQCGNQVRAVVFNLGYLPGGDRTIVTQPESTLAALDQSLGILESSGVIVITLYPGHEGGQRESSALETRMALLPPAGFHVWRMGQTNVPAAAPYLVLIQKAS